MIETDVMIVGSGPAGSSAGLLFQRSYGFRWSGRIRSGSSVRWLERKWESSAAERTRGCPARISIGSLRAGALALPGFGLDAAEPMLILERLTALRLVLSVSTGAGPNGLMILIYKHFEPVKYPHV